MLNLENKESMQFIIQYKYEVQIYEILLFNYK